MAEKILRIREVVSRTGLSRPTVYRLVQSGSFPRQVQLSPQCVGWKESEIDDWIEARRPAPTASRR